MPTCSKRATNAQLRSSERFWIEPSAPRRACSRDARHTRCVTPAASHLVAVDSPPLEVRRRRLRPTHVREALRQSDRFRRHGAVSVTDGPASLSTFAAAFARADCGAVARPVSSAVTWPFRRAMSAWIPRPPRCERLRYRSPTSAHGRLAGLSFRGCTPLFAPHRLVRLPVWLPDETERGF
jgi:hypothetical protein